MPVETLYWHDYETSGASPAHDRPWQFAGVRTTLDLEVIGEPLTVYAKPSLDVIPHPTAIRVTGISPYECEAKGLTEQGFIAVSDILLRLKLTYCIFYLKANQWASMYF